MTNDKIEEFKDVLRVQGVKAKGYGIIPKIVMQDTRLTRDSKAIYAYFCSYAGAGDTAFPSISKICFDLGFGSEDTYRSHMKLLKEFDYIRVTQEKDSKGKFRRNIYVIVSNPNPESIDKSKNEPSPKKQGTVENEHSPSPDFQGTDKRGTENRVTNINNISKINREKENNQLVSQLVKESTNKLITEEMTDEQTDELSSIYEQAQVDLFENDLKQTLKDNIKELYITNADKIKKLNISHIDEAIARYKNAKEEKEIKNPKLYFQKCLLSAIDEVALTNLFNIQ